MRRLKTYIYQLPGWPEFTWDNDSIQLQLRTVYRMQGILTGKMQSLGFSLQSEAFLENMTLDVLKNTEIEGVFLKPEEVRSSIARKLGMDIAGLVKTDRDTDGVVDMMLDATRNFREPLTKNRLFSWHSALFPSGRSGMYTIITGNWRNDSTGPMQVVSGPMGKERVHYEAPPAKAIEAEMRRFLKWFNHPVTMDPVIKSGVAHFWFITLHPFEDGNGRIARAIGDMQLARAEGNNQRFYSMSTQIRKVRNEYYAILEKTQKGSLDITSWLKWYLDCLSNALLVTDTTLKKILGKARFWENNSSIPLNERQRTMIQKVFEGFEGKLTSSKWAKITKCSHDTALRDIQDLVRKKILIPLEAGGRSSGYELNIR